MSEAKRRESTDDPGREGLELMLAPPDRETVIAEAEEKGVRRLMPLASACYAFSTWKALNGSLATRIKNA